MRGIYLSNRFYWALSVIIVLFFIGYGFRISFDLGQLLLVVLAILILIDVALLYWPKHGLTGSRQIPELMTLGDPNKIIIRVHNQYPFNLNLNIVDELPYQLQERNLELGAKVKGDELARFEYLIQPKERGEYRFGIINIFLNSPIGLVQRRIQCGEAQVGKVFPSVSQMKKYEILALARISTLDGIKKIRKIGHNYEFDQIKNYVIGDDIRAINWRATGKRNQLMVNQYQDERSQAVYVFIDKSRSMEMRFEKMRYLDYAVNSALVMLNVALKK